MTRGILLTHIHTYAVFLVDSRGRGTIAHSQNRSIDGHHIARSFMGKRVSHTAWWWCSHTECALRRYIVDAVTTLRQDTHMQRPWIATTTTSTIAPHTQRHALIMMRLPLRSKNFHFRGERQGAPSQELHRKISESIDHIQYTSECGRVSLKCQIICYIHMYLCIC